MRPLREHLRPLQSQRPRTPPRIDRDRGEHVDQLVLAHASRELHGAQVMLVQPHGELAQHRVLVVGRHPFDDQLMPRDAERECFAFLHERVEPSLDLRRRVLEQRVSGRIDGVLVQSDRELDQEVCQVPRQCRGFNACRGAPHLGIMGHARVSGYGALHDCTGSATFLADAAPISRVPRARDATRATSLPEPHQ